MSESSRRDSERDQTRVSFIGPLMQLHMKLSFTNREYTLPPTRAQVRNNQKQYPLGCDSARNTARPSRRRSMSYFMHYKHMSTSTVDSWQFGYHFQSFIVPRKNHKCSPSHEKKVTLVVYEYSLSMGFFRYLMVLTVVTVAVVYTTSA